MPSEIVAILSTVGVLQAGFLFLYLIRLKSGNRRANKMLAFVLLGISVRVGKSVLNYYLELDPWARNVGLSGFLMVGPFFYFYIRSVFTADQHLRRRDFFHLVPALIYATFSAIIPNEINHPASQVSYALVLLQLVIYLLYARRFLGKRKAQNPALFQWCTYLLVGVSAIWLFYLLIFLRLIPVYIGGAIFYSLLVYTFSHLLLKRHIFNVEKYVSSPINDDRVPALIDQLQELLQEKKLYLKSDVSLSQVAEELKMSTRVLSRIVNERLGKNFSELLNEYRVEEAKRYLTDPAFAEEKIATIAYESGFKNLTSFNEVFREVTRLTPSQYRRQFLIKES